jgi:hypothetical protein
MKYGEEEKVVNAPTSGLRKAPPTPKFIKEKPYLSRELFWYWDSFIQLNTERFKDGGEIPWSAIDRYCRRWEIISNYEFDFFVYMIREMDSIYLEEQNKKRERKLV